MMRLRLKLRFFVMTKQNEKNITNKMNFFCDKVYYDFLTTHEAISTFLCFKDFTNQVKANYNVNLILMLYLIPCNTGLQRDGIIHVHNRIVGRFAYGLVRGSLSACELTLKYYLTLFTV